MKTNRVTSGLALLLIGAVLAGCPGGGAKISDATLADDEGVDAGTPSMAVAECAASRLEVSVDGGPLVGGDAVATLIAVDPGLVLIWMRPSQFVSLSIPRDGRQPGRVDLAAAVAVIDVQVPEIGRVNTEHQSDLAPNALISGTLQVEGAAVVAGDQTCGRLDATVTYGVEGATHSVNLRGQFAGVLQANQVLRPN
jgi:hypothetical protein